MLCLTKAYLRHIGDAKALVLCRKMHAKRLISSAKLSEEIKSHLKVQK